MPGKRLGWLGLGTLLLAGSGCCSLWEHHCAPKAAPVQACVPCQPACCQAPVYSAPPPAPAGGCPVGCAPVANQWKGPGGY